MSKKVIFNMVMYTPEDGAEIKQAEGMRRTICGRLFFVVKDFFDCYELTDAETGMKISEGFTLSEAVLKAEEKLLSGNTERAIAKAKLILDEKGIDYPVNPIPVKKVKPSARP